MKLTSSFAASGLKKIGRAILFTAGLHLAAGPAFGQRPPGVPPLVIPPPTNQPAPPATPANPATGAPTTSTTPKPAPTFSPYFTGYVGAQLPSNPKPDAQQYKLEESDFLFRYGASDTAAALIHMYFQKRNSGQWIFFSSLIPAGIALTGQRKEQQIGGPNSGTVTTTNKPYVEPFAYGGLSLQFLGGLKALAWNRQNLYSELVKYQQTHKLSRSMRRRLLPFLIKTRNREFGD